MFLSKVKIFDYKKPKIPKAPLRNTAALLYCKFSSDSIFRRFLDLIFILPTVRINGHAI